MSLAILDQFEAKIKETVETIQLLQLEIEELKEKNSTETQSNNELRQENERLKNELNDVQERLVSFIGRMENIN